MIKMVVTMKVDYDKIVSVLALFDPEDIPYIKSKYYLAVFPENTESKEMEKVKVKKLGDKYDGSRK